jgi:hypothetical protein
LKKPLPPRRHPERSEGSLYLPLLVPVVACSAVADLPYFHLDEAPPYTSSS